MCRGASARRVEQWLVRKDDVSLPQCCIGQLAVGGGDLEVETAHVAE